MSFIKVLPVVFCVMFFVGCDDKSQQRLNLDVLAAKRIVQNRQKFSKEIIIATNDCIKAATSVQTLAAASNDQAETVEECVEAAQLAYGAYSPYDERWLAKAAVI